MDKVRNGFRKAIRAIAIGLNTATGGTLHPNVITIISFVMHIPIAFYIYTGNFYVAAGLLIFFGLFDALDGELARLQNRASKTGMFLDSTTDRLKEILLYIGICGYFVSVDQAIYCVWAVAACGLGIFISYLNAWGEVVTANSTHNPGNKKTNQQFRGGLMTFDVRMAMIALALALNLLNLAVVAIPLLSIVTILQRYNSISKKL